MASIAHLDSYRAEPAMQFSLLSVLIIELSPVRPIRQTTAQREGTGHESALQEFHQENIPPLPQCSRLASLRRVILLPEDHKQACSSQFGRLRLSLPQYHRPVHE